MQCIRGVIDESWSQRRSSFRAWLKGIAIAGAVVALLIAGKTLIPDYVMQTEARMTVLEVRQAMSADLQGHVAREVVGQWAGFVEAGLLELMKLERSRSDQIGEDVSIDLNNFRKMLEER